MMVEQVAPTHFAAWLAKQSSPVTVLDVREAWELQTASITPDGFVLKHVPMGDMPVRIGELGASDHPIACLCHHGARSDRVASFLVQNGFTNVCNIAGGIAAWARDVDHSIAQY